MKNYAGYTKQNSFYFQDEEMCRFVQLIFKQPANNFKKSNKRFVGFKSEMIQQNLIKSQHSDITNDRSVIETVNQLKL